MTAVASESLKAKKKIEMTIRSYMYGVGSVPYLQCLPYVRYLISASASAEYRRRYLQVGMYMTSAETALGLENKRDSSDATDRSTVMVRLGTQVVLCAARMMMIEEE